MAGTLCLQGGREFTPECREMDATLLERVADGSVAVLAGAARVGDDYARASARAHRHYEALGATVVVVPDPREDVDAARAVLNDDVALIVLPGGSPSSLRAVVSGDVETRLRELHAAGTAISGASAGAMVLCEHMMDPSTQQVVVGLGLVPGLALPHWSPAGASRWTVADDLDLWGLPECGGVVIEDGYEPIAVGHGEPARRLDGAWQPLPRR